MNSLRMSPLIDRVDLIDGTYADLFRPFLDRIIATAQSDS
ncbi:hypothetical protein Poly59_31920 [Rubripirellula reticaptiva]|uniref:Uncharacterized protein n=1 Tax=Rubripirellula reticaptiva TaxID=2528013 RepID=A0A5C6EVS8_9BACT|nr:hypothetical protein Poly59_31920 [Rubripirellula reticaptiva]